MPGPRVDVCLGGLGLMDEAPSPHTTALSSVGAHLVHEVIITVAVSRAPSSFTGS